MNSSIKVHYSISHVSIEDEDTPKISMRASNVVRETNSGTLTPLNSLTLSFKISFMCLYHISRPPSMICIYVQPFLFLHTTFKSPPWKVVLS